ncbi:MAG: hypothetical protein ACD_23C01342G0001 [uncultured bacterium]|nr:MAG: hypothetical protein ACD_23C01342G0001 [uncultured bacterium]
MRKRIIERQVPQVFFAGLAGADIVLHGHEMGNFAIASGYRRNGHFIMVQSAVLAPVDQIAVPHLPEEDGLPHFLIKAPILKPGFDQFPAMPPDRFIKLIAGQSGERLICPDDARLAVGNHNCAGGNIERAIVQSQSRFALPQTLFILGSQLQMPNQSISP